MLLEIKNLCTGFYTENGFSPVLEQINMTIAPQQTVALVGESGSGKSVTALSILQLLEKRVIKSSGQILFEGRDILKCSEIELRKVRGNRIAMIFQEPMTALNPLYPIGGQIIEPLMIHQNLDKKSAGKRAVELLELTGILNPDQRLNSFPHQLSGGQRQRVIIAMALACRPALLIADEPTTALDVTIQAQILALIKEMQQELGMAVLLITHDLPMVSKIADHIYIMHKGKIIEQGQTADVFAAPKENHTIHLLDSLPKGKGTSEVMATDNIPLLKTEQLRCHFPIKAGFFRRTVNTIKAVDDVKLTIRKNTTFGIVGESGSGKSTLGMSILRLVDCKGKIYYNGKNIAAYSNRQMRPLRKDLQVVFQDPFSSLSPRLTVEQIIGEGLTVHNIGKNSRQRRQIIADSLREVGLEPEMSNRYPHEFSGGQRQRISIARAVVLRPSFLVLDEPTSALDMTIQAQIIALLKKLQKDHGLTYLFISHDLRVIRAMADEIAVMQNGKIIETGAANAIFRNPNHPYTKKLFTAAFDLEITA